MGYTVRKEGEAMPRKSKHPDPFTGPPASWDVPARATPLKDMESIPLLRRGQSVPFGDRVVVRDEKTAIAMLVKCGWPCEVDDCTGWRAPTSRAVARVYKCRVCGFEEVVG
jgi:hypothetical protein